MPNIITYAAFEGGELNISGTEQEHVQEKVTSFITKYEADYLLKVLGYPLYKLLIAASGYPTIASGRFADLLNGAEYTDNSGYVRKWPGLKATVANPIANYVYFFFMRDNASFSSPVGEVKANVMNASRTGSATKQARAWNEMVETTEQLWEFLDINDDVYTEFDICQTKYTDFSPTNSLNI